MPTDQDRLVQPSVAFACRYAREHEQPDGLAPSMRRVGASPGGCGRIGGMPKKVGVIMAAATTCIT